MGWANGSFATAEYLNVPLGADFIATLSLLPPLPVYYLVGHERLSLDVIYATECKLANGR